MACIHTNDFESFQRLLGCAGPDDVPEAIAREYSMRLTMFHKDGGSGPLGTLGLIDCLRFCGFTPKTVAEAAAEIAWHEVKRGQRVEARFDDGWKAGEFLGFGQHGILHVQLDGIEEIKECYRHLVRLSNAPKPEMIALPAVEEPPVETAELMPPAVEIDWTQAEVGEEVWAPINGEMQECKFTKLRDEQIIVTFNGDDYTLPADKVIRAAVTA